MLFFKVEGIAYNDFVDFGLWKPDSKTLRHQIWTDNQTMYEVNDM